MRDPFQPRQRRVLERLFAYMHECGNTTVSSITYGRGLRRLEAANGRAIIWMPDTRYNLGLP
jgi:hypothetical protein